MNVCMARQGQMQRPWSDRKPAYLTTSAQIPPEQRQIPGIATALGRHLPTTTDHRLPPMATSLDAYNSRPQNFSTPFTESASVRSIQPSSLVERSSARPEKRARWHWSQDATPSFGMRVDGQYHQEHDRNWEPHATSSSLENTTVSFRQEKTCSNCAGTDHLVAKIVSELLVLDENIRNPLALSKTPQRNTSADITKLGLKNSLSFASQSIEANSGLVREAAVNRQRGTLLAADPGSNTEPTLRSGHFNSDIVELEEAHSNERASHCEDQPTYSTPGPPEDTKLGPPDYTTHSAPSNNSNIMRRTPYQEELPLARAAGSPHDSPPIATFGSTQSPASSHPSSRPLVSPSSYTPYPSSVPSIPSSYSDGLSPAVQTSHVQDLQHQISTKRLAIQTLQREHDQLLAAFSRSQTRCATLDNKLQVSDREINTLSEEKMQLQQRVEALETRLEELSREKEEARRQLSTAGAQWQRIMAMSSQLQAHSIEETRHFRSDREAWERDRDGLENRIHELEVGRLMVGPPTHATPVPNTDILSSTSLETLREEVVRLRRKCGELESLLRDIQGETEHMGPTLATLANMSVRISAFSSPTRYDTIKDSEMENGEASSMGK